MTAPIIVSGFDAFGTYDKNTSAQIIDRLRLDHAKRCRFEVLPTSYARAGARIEELVSEHTPSALIMLGQAEMAGDVRMERCARNRDDADGPDNDGENRGGGLIVSGGPPTYSSSLPVDEIAAMLDKLGFIVELSDDAGGYVCNHVFYRALHAAAGRPGIAAGFVHVPADPSGGPRRALEAIRAVLHVVERR